MKVCVLIPALNESLTIGRIVEDVKKLFLAPPMPANSEDVGGGPRVSDLDKKIVVEALDVVVIDDGSTDDSAQMAQKKGAVVIRHAQRQGKGQSLRDGFEYALKESYDCVVTMDGDGQHDTADLERFIQKAQEHPNSIVTGTRMENPQGMPPVRRMTNRFMSWLISLACKQKVPDTQCGYRLISCEILKAIQISSSDYEIETEVLMKAAKKGFKIYSVPIKTIYRNEKSKVHPIVDTVRFFNYFFRELWTSNS